MKPYVNPGEKIMEELARKGKVDIIYPKGYDDEDVVDTIVQDIQDEKRGK